MADDHELTFVLLTEGELRNNAGDGILYLVVERIRQAEAAIARLDQARAKTGARKARDGRRARQADRG